MGDISDKTVSDIFDALGGPAAVARLLELKGTSTASEMKRRGRIPVEHWPALVAVGVSRSADWLTYEALVQMHSRKAVEFAGVNS